MRYLIALTIALFALPAAAADVMVMDGWCRPNKANTACYGTLHNAGDTAVTITEMSSPAAKHIEAHETTVDGNGRARMRPIMPLTIQPDDMVTLEPGGNHIMVMGLTAPLAEGADFPVELTFADGQNQIVDFAVQSAKLDK